MRIRLSNVRRRRSGHTRAGAAIGAEGSTPRLTARFAVYAAAALLVAGGGIFLYLRSSAITRAERQALAQTGLVSKSVLSGRLRASDFAGAVRGSRLRQLDWLVRREALPAGALRAKLYDPTGLVVYSSDHELIGTRSPDADLVRAAVAGHPVSDVSTLNAEGGTGPNKRVLEAYVPVSLSGGPPIGVFELYQDDAPIMASARDTFMPVAGVVALVLLALYLSFFPILRRVTARLRRQMDHIEHQSLHDSLTELPNRLLFRDRVSQAISSARQRGERLAVMLIDLDRFKEVNDTLGHQSGDVLLKRVAGRLQSAIREGDTVARLGGDEFGVLVPAVDGPDAVLALAEKLRGSLLAPCDISGLELEVEASVGITLYPDHGEDVDLLLQRADIAMYIAKDAHVPMVYAPDQDRYSSTRLALMSQLRRAIANRELVVHYQPQAEMRGGEIRSVEALVRWEHPERGLLAPEEFIPLAEHIGLIRPLTAFVLDEALRQCAQWRDDGIDLSVAVNISGRDLLDQRLPDEVHECLRRWSVEPDHLELEITENTVLSDPVRARGILERLSDIGVRLAIDDYGTGNSSLAYLKRLPVSVLKIDRSFVLNMQADHDDAIIVRSTIDLGHNLGLVVVAEGVEDEHAWQALADLGCDTAQGYFLGRPVPPELIPELVSGVPSAARGA
jgi:diguanylate cyclase (GGDEF)-like protein